MKYCVSGLNYQVISICEEDLHPFDSIYIYFFFFFAYKIESQYSLISCMQKKARLVFLYSNIHAV
jgi:hypothetical protein